MNRTVRVSVLMSFGLCLLAGERVLAQFSEESIARHWEKLPDGAQILRLWTDKDVKANQPQIAILRLTSKQFEKFHSDVKDYLERNKVFGEHVKLGRIISYADITEPYGSARKPRSGDTDPIFVVEHNPYCDSAIIQYDGS